MSGVRPDRGSPEWEAARAYARERMGIADRRWYQRKRFYLPLAVLSPVILLILLVIVGKLAGNVGRGTEQEPSPASTSATAGKSTMNFFRAPFQECKRRIGSQAEALDARLEHERNGTSTYFVMYVFENGRITANCEGDQNTGLIIIDKA